jgi:hypothetical protein
MSKFLLYFKFARQLALLLLLIVSKEAAGMIALDDLDRKDVDSHGSGEFPNESSGLQTSSAKGSQIISKPSGKSTESSAQLPTVSPAQFQMKRDARGLRFGTMNQRADEENPISKKAKLEKKK